MSDVFGETYSQAYDVLYQDKDYGAECDLIEHIFKRYAAKTVQSVLDIGCGTGNHSVELASRGYRVVGIDRSQEMLALALAKANAHDLPVFFHQGDIRQFELKKTFDCCLMMFAVLGYQTKNTDIIFALNSARKHLVTDGLLIADIWYGPAVLKQRPGDRIRVVPTVQGSILRTSQGKLDVLNHLCKVNFRLWEIRERELIKEVEEEHLMRYFFPRELELFLETTGFRMVRIGAFPDFDKEPDEDTWNAMIVAKAI
jgi:SAM-dependent methyltransferase